MMRALKILDTSTTFTPTFIDAGIWAKKNKECFKKNNKMNNSILLFICSLYFK